MGVTVPCWRAGWPVCRSCAGTTVSHADGLGIWRLKKQCRRVFECVEGSRLLHRLQNEPSRSISDCFYPNHLHGTDAALESVSCFELPVVSFTLHCVADFQLASVPCLRTQSVAVKSVICDRTNWKIEHITMQNIWTIYHHTVVKASLSDRAPLQLSIC